MVVDLRSVPDFRYEFRGWRLLPHMELGQFSSHQEKGSCDIFKRDPYGLNPFFYALSSTSVFVSNRIDALLDKSIPFQKIRSLLPGVHFYDRDTHRFISSQVFDLDSIPGFVDLGLLGEWRDEVRATLEDYFYQLRDKLGPDSTLFVCLSGGLDSTTALYYAQQYFPNVKAITVSVVDEGKIESEDMIRASNIADALGVEHHKVLVTEEDILSSLAAVVEACQDWRGFNVHCAILNYFIAKYLANSEFRSSDPIAITGDLMNEAVCDYEYENHSDAGEYKVPRLNNKRRIQRVYLRGLDGCDREIGVFSNWGIRLIQPYASVLPLYQALSNEALALGKQFINGELIPPELRMLVSSEKIRAQVGGSGSLGVVDVLKRNKVTESTLYGMLMSRLVPNETPVIQSASPFELGRFRFS